jgi:hypothetical protein
MDPEIDSMWKINVEDKKLAETSELSFLVSFFLFFFFFFFWHKQGKCNFS